MCKISRLTRRTISQDPGSGLDDYDLDTAIIYDKVTGAVKPRSMMGRTTKGWKHTMAACTISDQVYIWDCAIAEGSHIYHSGQRLVQSLQRPERHLRDRHRYIEDHLARLKLDPLHIYRGAVGED